MGTSVSVAHIKDASKQERPIKRAKYQATSPRILNGKQNAREQSTVHKHALSQAKPSLPPSTLTSRTDPLPAGPTLTPSEPTTHQCNCSEGDLKLDSKQAASMNIQKTHRPSVMNLASKLGYACSSKVVRPKKQSAFNGPRPL